MAFFFELHGLIPRHSRDVWHERFLTNVEKNNHCNDDSFCRQSESRVNLRPSAENEWVGVQECGGGCRLQDTPWYDDGMLMLEVTRRSDVRSAVCYADLLIC